MNINSLRFVIVLFLGSFLTGCQTLNSQVLDLHPEVQVHRQLPKDSRIDIQTKDLRPSQVIGYRLNGQNPQPSIVLKDSTLLMQHVTEHALEDMGVRRFYSGEFTLKVSLLELNYKAEKKNLKQTINLDMKVRMEISKGAKSYTGTYATTKQHKLLKTPDEAKNEEMISEVVLETLTRALNDPQFLDFIQFN